jgi:hypothetical protein
MRGLERPNAEFICIRLLFGLVSPHSQALVSGFRDAKLRIAKIYFWLVLLCIAKA